MTELNQVINADCLDVLPSFPDGSVNLIINDPPHYGVVKDKWDNQWKTKQAYLDWCEAWLKQCLRVLHPRGSIYIWGSIGEKSDSVIHLKLLMDSLGFHFKDWITWKKQRGMGNRRGWLYTREETLWYVKDKKDFIWNTDAQYSDEDRKSGNFGFANWKKGYRPKSDKYRLTNVWDDIPETTWNWQDIKVKHSTPKPVPALARIIAAHTATGETVLDCFLGSGSTAVAAQLTGRNFIGIEIDSEYCEIAQTRLLEEIKPVTKKRGKKLKKTSKTPQPGLFD
jgi:site-specific DNA-methyltransferase (adenine-specific)